MTAIRRVETRAPGRHRRGAGGKSGHAGLRGAVGHVTAAVRYRHVLPADACLLAPVTQTAAPASGDILDCP